MKRFYTWMLICGCFTNTFAQGIHGVIGADAWMQGGNSVNLNSVFAISNNPAQLSYLKKWQAGIYSRQQLGLKELNLARVAVAVPHKIVNVGIAANYFGFDNYNQQRLTIAASKKLAQTFSLGVQLNYVGTQIKEYGSAGALVLGVGFNYEPTNKLQMGCFLYNPNQQKVSAHINHKVPAYARLGLLYKVNSKVNLLTEAEQELEQKTRYRFGVNYAVHPKFGFAVGASSQPMLYSFGTTFNAAGVVFDVAASVHQTLGVIPQVGLKCPIQPN